MTLLNGRFVQINSRVPFESLPSLERKGDEGNYTMVPHCVKLLNLAEILVNPRFYPSKSIYSDKNQLPSREIVERSGDKKKNISAFKALLVF